MSRYNIKLSEEEAQALLSLGEKIKEAGASLKGLARHMDTVRAQVLEAINRHEESVKGSEPYEDKNLGDYLESLPRTTVEDESHYKIAVSKFEDHDCCPKCFGSMVPGDNHFECTNCKIIWRI